MGLLSCETAIACKKKRLSRGSLATSASQRTRGSILAVPPLSREMLSGAGSAFPPERALRENFERKKLFQTLLEAADAGCASERNENGQLPLHVAVWNGAPAEVLKTLLDAHPEAAQEKMDNSEWLPLHVALQAKASPKVVQMLLEAHPAAASTAAVYGWLPLHVAARRGASAEIVEALLAVEPAALAALAESGDTPRMLALKYGQHASSVALQAAEDRVAQAQAEAQRLAERNAWDAADRAQKNELERIVSERVEELQLARRLLEGSQKAPPEGVKADAMMEAGRMANAKLKEETAAKEQLKEELFTQKAEVERLQAELDKKGKKKGEEGGEWTKHTSKKNGKPFWYNKKTKEKKWKDPNK